MTTRDERQRITIRSVGNKGDVEDAWNWILDNVRTLDATGGIKPFPDYPFARGLVDALCKNRILIVAKSRQMMATWTVCAWMLFSAHCGEPGIYILLSKGARDTGELIERLRVMVTNLPEDLRDGIRVKAEEVVLPSQSRIIALPATEYAPRMHSPKGVFWDEMAFTTRSEGIWAAVKPAVDSGGSFVGVSTPNGTDNVFYMLYTDRSNGFGKLRLHWSQHPQRDEAWLTEARRGLSQARWRQEYEIDFDVLADRVYDEFEPELHILARPYRWNPAAGRTCRGIDFGYRHPYVVWVQVTPDGEMTVFDEWEGFDATIDEMAKAIREVDSRHGITEAEVTWSGCDPAGAAVSDSGLSAVDRLGQRGFKLVWRTSEVMTGVELVKSLLLDANGRVRLRFSPDLKRTLYHLRHYRWEQGQDRPAKDDVHDHAMDALRYLIVNLYAQKPVNWSGARVMGAKW